MVNSPHPALPRRPRVALYAGGGAPYHHAALFARAGYGVDFLFPGDIRAGALEGYDALVVPGGGHRAMLGQIGPLGWEGARAIREYVEGGGMYLGSCAGSYDAMMTSPGFLRACPAQRDLCLLPVPAWNGDEGEEGIVSPGVGVMWVRNSAPQHPLMPGMPARFRAIHYNGPLFAGGEALIAVEGRTEHFTPAESFLGKGTGPFLIDRAAREGVPAAVLGERGAGRVVLWGCHPEFGPNLAMDEEGEAAPMLRNALAWQLACNGTERPHVPLWTDSAAREETVPLERIREACDTVRRLVGELARRRGREGAWLRPEYAMASFGLEPARIWAEGLEEIARLIDAVERLAPGVPPRILSVRPPEEWNVDVGFRGVLPLLEDGAGMLHRAIDLWDVDLGPPPRDPWEPFDRSPYHLVAGSYLSALGHIAGAKLLCEAAPAVGA